MRRSVLLLLLPVLVLAPFALAPSVPERAAGPDGEAAALTDTLAVDLIDGTSQAEVDAMGEALGFELEWTSPFSHDDALLRATPTDPKAALAALRAHPLVEAAEPLILMQASGAPNDPLWPKQWNLRAIGVEAGWRAGAGEGVIVAVLDTGVSRVEDLAGVDFAEGVSFVAGVESTDDDVGHGTHVAGTIAQATNNGVGVAGIAPEATILPMKVLGATGSGSADKIAAAVDEAVDRGADVINLSLGGMHSPILHLAVEKAVRSGVVVVASAGNTGRLGVGCPGHADGVLGVSALGPDATLAPYSSYGPGVEIAAPGGDLRKEDGGILQDTIVPGGHAYTPFQGTSMAAPHVAGAAAVLRGTGLSARAAESALLNAAEGGGPGDLRLGHGRMDLEAALEGLDRTKRPSFLAIISALVMILSILGKLSGRERTGLLVLALVFGGGLWLVGDLGVPRWMTADPTGLPAALGAPGLGSSILWASAALPIGFAALFGLTKRGSIAAMALALTWAVGLTWGAASGWIDVAWLPPIGDRVWLTINGLLALAVAMGLTGLREVRA
jgi:serine protease